MRFSFTTVALCVLRHWRRKRSNLPEPSLLYSQSGFITPTEARRISFEETVPFEKIHEETYRDFGFELVSVEPGSLVERAGTIKAAIR
jgi:predicted ATPase